MMIVMLVLVITGMVRRMAEQPRQALLVLEQKPLVAGVQVHRQQLACRVGADSLHELHRLRNRLHDALVLGLDRRRLHVAQIPVHGRVQVGKA